MKTSTVIWIIIALAVVAGGWYYVSNQKGGYSYGSYSYDSKKGTEAQTPATLPETAPVAPSPATSQDTASPAPVLGLGAGSLYLVADNGMTLYFSTEDTVGVSNCAGSCADNWPPYTTGAKGTLSAAAGISGKVGTVKRADGSTQVTYNGMPLYFWVGDTKAGQTTGNRVGPFLLAKP
jgi:predicted lipoprotein with Yx(FWY)xxD motif